MNTFVGCMAPEMWWSDRRTRWRVIVLVIVLISFGWLIEFPRLSVLESGGVLMVLALAAGFIINRVVDGRQPAGVAAAIAGLAAPPLADGAVPGQHIPGQA